MKNKCDIKIILLTIANALFLLLFLTLSYFNRFAVDDYYHIYDERVFGIWGGMLEGYNNWGGRWTSYLLWDIIYHIYNINHSILFIYSFSVIILFIIALFLLLLKIFYLLEIKAGKFQILNYSILFSAFFFFISWSRGEIWFWVQSSAMFMFSITSFILGFSLILSKGNKIIHYIFIFICFVYAGGASETYSFFYNLFLILVFSAFYLSPKNSIIFKIKESAFYKIIFGFVFLFASFFISWYAPGNDIRATWLPEPSFLNSFYITLKSFGKILFFDISEQMLWLILFGFIFINIGNIIKNNIREIIKFRNIIKYFVLSALILVIAIYAMLFPCCYILSDIGPYRAMSQIVLVIAVFVASWAFFVGYKYYINKKFINISFYLSVIILIATLCIMNIQQYFIVSEYADALDKRTEYLKELQYKKNTKTVTVKQLPPSGFLYSAEISDDTMYFGNEHYRKGLFLDYKVMLSYKKLKK